MAISSAEDLKGEEYNVIIFTFLFLQCGEKARRNNVNIESC